MTRALVFVAALAGLALSGQDPAVFRTESNLVVLHVNVFDRHDDPVSNLTREHFMVIEDGRAQDIGFFSSEDMPVTVGLVLDNSSSMIPRRKMVVAANMAFANSSHPEDELFIVNFTENVRLALPPVVRFTSSRDLLQATLNTMKPGGQTAMYDAVIRALDHIQAARHQKRVLIVLSDGEDTASVHAKNDMLERAKRSDVVIYTVGLVDRTLGAGGMQFRVLDNLAEIGGGIAYFPSKEEGVISAFERIARNIRQGYSIGYVPTNAARDGSFRAVTVMVRASGRVLDAKYRHGYTAAHSTASTQ
jgi:VWFA-related protein